MKLWPIYRRFESGLKWTVLSQSGRLFELFTFIQKDRPNSILQTVHSEPFWIVQFGIWPSTFITSDRPLWSKTVHFKLNPAIWFKLKTCESSRRKPMGLYQWRWVIRRLWWGEQQLLPIGWNDTTSKRRSRWHNGYEDSMSIRTSTTNKP